MILADSTIVMAKKASAHLVQGITVTAMHHKRKEEKMIELKPCPFCGDEVELLPTGLRHWRYAIRHKTKDECVLEAQSVVIPYEKDVAIEMWNRRADDDGNNFRG